MFIVSLTYKRPIEEIEKYIKKHSDFLKNLYAENKLIFTGRKNPITGGDDEVLLNRLRFIYSR